MVASSLRKLARAGRKHELTWRYGYNFGPTISHKFNSPHLFTEAARILGELNRDGIAITSADILLKDSSAFNELCDAVDGLEREREAELTVKRAAANDPAIGQKTFNVEMLGSNPVLDPQSIYARFALQNPILQIANAYFGMYTCLRYYNVWHTFATQAEARESQLWHHDREDHFILKAFVYFSDVDEEAGPFTYAAGSHLKRGVSREPAFVLEGGVKRSNDEQMAEVVPNDRWVRATGKRGTIIFADTRGYHKGGLARKSDRIMYTCMFTSQASESKELFLLPRQLDLPSDKAACFALSNPLRPQRA